MIPSKESRRFSRFSVSADGVVEAGGNVFPVAVKSLSVGGAFVEFQCDPPRLEEGTPVILVLLDTPEVNQMRVHGASVYQRNGGVGISFDQAELLLLWAHYYGDGSELPA